MRSDKKILEQTEQLARELARYNGFMFSDSLLFRISTNTRIRSYWIMACLAQKIITNTDPNDCEGYYIDD